MLQNKYQAYKQQSVQTMTQGEMLTAVYDALLKSLYQAEREFEAKNYAAINTHLKKAQEILSYLKATLNYKYEISENLSMLYDFFISELVKANVHKDSSQLSEVAQMIAELKDSFIQADKNMRAGTQGSV